MKKRPEPTIDEDWMSTYGDMVTLLLCFFVMMLSVSSPDVAKFELIQAGLNESLGKKEVTRPIEMMMMELADDIQSMDADEDISLGSDTQGVVLELGDSLMFSKGSADLQPSAIPVLKKIAATLQSDRYNSFNFSIEGHTSDETYSSERYPSNWELSSARASAVARFLESRGIARVRLKVTGYYDNVPKFPNHDIYGQPIPQNRIKNRRVTIHIEPNFK